MVLSDRLFSLAAASLAWCSLCVNWVLAKEPFDPASVLDGDDKLATVMIAVHGNSVAGVESTEVGTAFFISPQGFAITAAHIFFRGGVIEDPQQRLNKTSDDPDDFITGRIGSAGAAPQRFQLITLFPTSDAALLQLLDPASTVRLFNVCGDVPKASDRLFAFGYTAGQGLNAPSGYRLGNLDGQRFPVNIDLNPGMSGGPVFNSYGQVFAVALSGVRDPGYQGYNFVLPIQFLPDLLAQARVTEICRDTVQQILNRRAKNKN